jgi:CIC family chloride channel protein
LLKLDPKTPSVFFFFGSVIVGILMGAIGSLMASMFRYGINYIYSQQTVMILGFPFLVSYIAVLSMTALIVAYLRKLASGIPFQGIADSIYYAHTATDKTKIKLGFLSTLAAFVSASGGASVGQYGPLVHFGTIIGVSLKRFFNFGLGLDVFIGAGVAAAISSGFGAPIAGLIFAHEVVLRHYSHKSIMAIATASCVSYAFSSMVWKTPQVFDFPILEFDLFEVVLLSFVSGPIYAFSAIFYMQVLLQFAKLSQKISINYIRIIVGIVVLAFIGSFIPEVMGLGTNTVFDIFSGNFALSSLIIIWLFKIIATAVSLNFGFFGGIFSPAILVGASTGAIFSSVLYQLGVTDQMEQIFVICGISAVAGSVLGAPISMIIIVIELTGSYIYGLSTLVSLAISVSIVQVKFGSSYFDKQLSTRGIDMSLGRSGIFLRELSVIELINKDFICLKLETSVSDAKTLMFEKNTSEAVVTGNDDLFIGKLDLISLLDGEGSHSIKDLVDVNCITIPCDASLQDAMEIASNFVGEFIPIIDKSKNKIIGIISESVLFATYLDQQDGIRSKEKI